MANSRRRDGAKAKTAAHLIEVLRGRITRHELPPGTKLLEQELSAEFEVPRSRVRDCLAALEQRGLIQRIPNRGAIVERLDPAQIFHIYAVREALEGVCARLATENMPPESWQDMVDLFGKPMEEDVENGDLEAYVHKLETFRRRMHEGACNPILAEMLENIQDRTRMIVRRIIILPGRARVGLEEHRALLRAMRNGDAEAAEAATRANIRSGVAFLKRYKSFIL
jgi:DNA-binding GntR family transcriptional regulator